MRYIIVDLEATCWENNPNPSRMEIIEIGAVGLAGSQGPINGVFSSFVRPVVEPKLSHFCRLLTTIRQEDVDQAGYFWEVFPRFLDWVGGDPFVLSSWGRYDLNQFRLDCRRHGQLLPLEFERHIDLKKQWARLNGVQKCGMARAMKIAGLSIEGTHHRASDDAKNIAKLALSILPRLEAEGALLR